MASTCLLVLGVKETAGVLGIVGRWPAFSSVLMASLGRLVWSTAGSVTLVDMQRLLASSARKDGALRAGSGN